MALAFAPAAVAQTGTPSACFTQSPTSPTTGQSVTFNSSCSTNVYMRGWDLDNDGQYDDGTSTSVSKTWTLPGNYTVKLGVINRNNNVDTETKTVTIANRLPTADFTISPTAPTTGQAVQFTATSTDPEGTAMTHSWDLDNDGSYDDGTGATANKLFTTAGTYTIKLRTQDANNGVDTETKTVTVAAANRAPTANFTISNANPSTGANVTFTSTSTDPDGTISAANTKWDLDNDGQYDDATGTTASRSFATAGTYTIKLQVTDDNGASATVSKTVTAGNRTPLPNFTFSPAAPLTNQEVTFTSTSVDPDGSIAAETWDLDHDGQYDDASGPTAKRTFTAPGTFTVKIRAVDNNGGVSTGTHTVTVSNRAPTIAFTSDPAAPIAGETVTFTSGAADSDGSIAKLEWDLDGDGQYDDATGATATATFPASGSYVIGLRATDDRGTAASGTQTLDVSDPLVPDPTTPGDTGGGGNFDTSVPTTPVPQPPTTGGEPPVGPPTTIGRLDPFPIVRIKGRALPTGARISLLTVKAPTGAKVELRCFGKRCPVKRSAAKVKGKRSAGTVRFKKIERLLPAGTVLRILVTKKNVIGKYTQFKIRRGRAPQRDDRCLMPGSSRGVSCE